MKLSDEVKKLGYADNVLTGASNDELEVGASCSQCTGGCYTCNTCQTGESVRPPVSD